VLAYFGLCQLPIVERAVVCVGVAVYAAEVAATATVNTCHTTIIIRCVSVTGPALADQQKLPVIITNKDGYH